MQNHNYALVRAVLSPVSYTSADRLLFSSEVREGRRSRLASVRLLKPLDPPATASSKAVALWAMCDEKRFEHSLLCAGAMACSGILRPAVVTGPLRERLMVGVGFEWFKRSLLYEGESLYAGGDIFEPRRISVVGLAVMYVFVRGVSAAASRHMLRRMPSRDQKLAEAMRLARRFKRPACNPIGNIIIGT
ncbi:hypothetical protein [Dyella sp.]|uniref:hypothetical protein n=1 Tax=Dyella sp. TaxID=1869338 RepID=UPI002FDB315A